MSEDKDWQRRINDMLERIRRIEISMENLSYDDFLSSNDKIDAVERNLEIIGEASNHIPARIKSLYPHIAWEKIYGMRNVLAHGYDIILEDVVWHTATIWVQELKAVLLDIRSKS